MLLLEGRSVAASLRAKVKNEIEFLTNNVLRPPCLAVILVGDDPGSQVYVRNKQKACAEVGIRSISHQLPASTKQAELESLINELNTNPEVDGILLQLPLPKGLDAQPCLESISPEKDVDGLHPENQGRLCLGLNGIRPCTPAGVMFLLDYYNYDLSGKKVAVLGRSNLVGRPLSIMLNLKPTDATVTMCHSKTENLDQILAESDFIFLAIGIPKFLKPEMVKPEAVIIDVGINRLDNGLCGDADFEALENKVAALTPVPGGIGLMTIAQLLQNTIIAWKTNLGIITTQ